MNPKSKLPLLAQALFATLLLFASCAPHAEEAKSTERWPWYGEWEHARFAAFSPLVQSLLKRDEAEALRLIKNGASLVDFVSEHEIRRMAEPRVKIAYVGGEPEADYPLVILAAVADLPRVVAAIGTRSPGVLTAPDPKGNTALAWAARSGHAEVVKVLLAHGLDPLHRDDDHYTPLSLAVSKKKAEVTRLLIAAIPRERYPEVGIVDQVWMASYFAMNGVRSCIAASRFCCELKIFNRSAHSRIMHSEVLRNGLHGMLSGEICQCHGLVTGIALFKLRQRLRNCPTLCAWNLSQCGFLLNLRLHLLHKSFRAQINLPLQLRPYTRQSRAFMDEADILGNGAGTVRSKLPKYPIRLQPRRRSRLPASCQKTTPRPSLQMLHHLRPQRIQHHIARQLQQVTIPLNHNGFIAPLEYMSDTIM